ncbi:MAG TPA: NUDIX hydrolase [Candidatus Saccharimonadales bacterium]|jgi:8-oxo-dGTP pyrophosphatase MutT (NUDIX family)
MSDPKYSFQYCQKIIVFSEDWSSVLLAKRQGEADYDGAFSFIGGKMDTSDESILAGLAREKNEEIGESAKIHVYPKATNNLFFRKKDGSSMILPHYLAQFMGGKITLNPEEYSEFRWVAVDDLPALEPKIPNIPDMVAWGVALKEFVNPKEFVEI